MLTQAEFWPEKTVGRPRRPRVSAEVFRRDGPAPGRGGGRAGGGRRATADIGNRVIYGPCEDMHIMYRIYNIYVYNIIVYLYIIYQYNTVHGTWTIIRTKEPHSMLMPMIRNAICRSNVRASVGT